MHKRIAGLFLVLALQGCRLFGDDDGGLFALVNTDASIGAPVDGSIVLANGRIEWRRVYAAADVATEATIARGLYDLRGDSLYVSWVTNAWYALGELRGDTLDVYYSGPGDEPHREIYVKRALIPP
jgi:hypothetical protein